MTRADRLEVALRQIVQQERVTRHGYRDPNEVFMEIDRIARAALDLDYPWPGAIEYRAREDHEIAREWMEKHAKADEVLFAHRKPIAAVYIEPVADHYAAGRKELRLMVEFLMRNRIEDDYQ